jgi:hypothetical protein
VSSCRTVNIYLHTASIFRLEEYAETMKEGLSYKRRGDIGAKIKPMGAV